MLHRVLIFLSVLLTTLRKWAADYEPARAAGVALVVFQGLAALGISVGPFPGYVDKVLGVIALTAVAIQTWYVRRRVSSPATVARLTRHT